MECDISSLFHGYWFSSLYYTYLWFKSPPNLDVVFLPREYFCGLHNKNDLVFIEKLYVNHCQMHFQEREILNAESELNSSRIWHL